jgi:hypothetical protein
VETDSAWTMVLFELADVIIEKPDANSYTRNDLENKNGARESTIIAPNHADYYHFKVIPRLQVLDWYLRVIGINP